MKIDFLKVSRLIGLAMNVAEKMGAAGSGPEKEAAVIESINEGAAEIEDIFGLDFVDNTELNTLLKNYIQARVALMNAIEAYKKLRPAQPD